MIYYKDITASTNLDARVGSPGDVFTADYQSAGRGRLDHAWQSSAGKNLMFSIVLSAGSHPPAEIATLPLVVGLAVIKSLASTSTSTSTSTPTQLSVLPPQPPTQLSVLPPQPPTPNPQPPPQLSVLPPQPPFLLKWPNDILVEGRKICGILCERIGDKVIAGIGVNVNQTEFPSDIASRATSLAAILGRPVDRAALLETLVASITTHHARWLADGFATLHGEFAPFDMLRGKSVSVLATDMDEKPISGVCGGIQRDGTLLVGATRVWAGEAHVL